MSLQSVREFLNINAPEITITPLEPETAQQLNGSPTNDIALTKTLCFSLNRQTILVVIPASLRLDHQKMGDAFKNKARMLTADEILLATGHPVQGVCPLGLQTPLPVYCDTALRKFGLLTVLAGTHQHCFQITPEKLLQLCGASWITLSRTPS